MRERAADLAQRLLVVRLGGVAPAFSPLNLPTSRARAVRSRPGSANVAFGVRHQAAARPRHVRGPDRLNWSSGLAGGGGYMPAPVTAGGGAAHGAARTPPPAVPRPLASGAGPGRPRPPRGGRPGSRRASAGPTARHLPRRPLSPVPALRDRQRRVQAAHAAAYGVSRMARSRSPIHQPTAGETALPNPSTCSRALPHTTKRPW